MERKNEEVEKALREFPRQKLDDEKKKEILQALQAENPSSGKSTANRFKKIFMPVLSIAILAAFMLVVTLTTHQPSNHGLSRGNHGESTSPSTLPKNPATGKKNQQPPVKISDFIDYFKGVTPLNRYVIGDKVPESKHKAAIAALIADAASSMGADGQIFLPVRENLDGFFHASPGQLKHIKQNSEQTLFSNTKYKWTRLRAAVQYSQNEQLTAYLQHLTDNLREIHTGKNVQSNYTTYVAVSKKIIRLSRAIQSVTRQSWQVTPVFTQKGWHYRGIQHRIGFKVTANPKPLFWDSNKEMWSIWGNPDVVHGNFEILAQSQTGDTSFTLYKTQIPYAEKKAVPYQLQTSLKFPHPGLWALRIYVGQQFFGRIVVRASDHSSPEIRCPSAKNLETVSKTDVQNHMKDIIAAIKRQHHVQLKDWKVKKVVPMTKGGVYGKMGVNWCGKEVAQHSWLVRLYFPQLEPNASMTTMHLFISKSQTKGWVVWELY